MGASSRPDGRGAWLGVRLSQADRAAIKARADLRRAGGLLNQVARELNTRHRPNQVETALEHALRTVARASEDVSKLISDARRV